MAEKAIEVEARVRDFVTTNMKAIEASLRDFDREFKTIAGSTTQNTSTMSKTFDQLKNSWNVTAIAATSLIGAMGAMAIFQKTTQLISDAHKKSQEYNTVISQLTASLGYFSNALVEQAAQLEKTKYIHQTEILQADQRLSNYIKEESNIKRLIPAIVDLARAKGIDLAAAANLVATAYQRGENAASKDEATVGRLGITFKKTGDETRDVANITDELNKKFGKQSQAVADSLDGWSKFSFWVSTVTEDLGKMIFGLSKSESEFKNYEAALKLIADRGSLPLDKVIAWKTGFIEATDEALEAAQKLVKNYEDKRDRDAFDRALDSARKQGDAVWAHTQELQKEINDMTLAGKRQTILAEEQAEIAKYGDLTVIHQLYGARLVEIDKKIAEEKVKTGQEEIDRINKEQKDIVTMEQIGLNQRTVDLQAYVDEVKRLNDVQIEQKEQQNKAAARRAEAEKNTADYLKSVEDKKQRDQKVAVSNTTAFLRDLASKHKEFMLAYKAMAIAQTVMDTRAAAMSVYKGFSTIPFIGQALGIAGAAATIAYGLSQVQEIMNQKFERGTRYAPGGLSLVGEGGAELLDIPRGSRVYNHTETQNMLGGTQYHFHFPDNAILDHSAVDRLEKELPGLLERAAKQSRLNEFKSLVGIS